MALAETAGAALAQSNTNTVTSGSLTPTAGALQVAMVTCGNGNGISITGASMTDNSGSGAWTLLVSAFNALGSALAAVYIRAAWSGAATMTFTTTPTTAANVAIFTRQFAGARPVAGQTGATVSVVASSANAESITPTVTGSQCVGAFATSVDTEVLTPNASTTIYAQTDTGSLGDTEAMMKATALSVAGTPISMGFTNAALVSDFALAEILATASLGNLLVVFP